MVRIPRLVAPTSKNKESGTSRCNSRTDVAKKKKKKKKKKKNMAITSSKQRPLMLSRRGKEGVGQE